MATTTIEEKQLSKFAERVYREQKSDFIQDLSKRIRKSIDMGMIQVKKGEFISLKESEKRLHQEFF